MGKEVASREDAAGWFEVLNGFYYVVYGRVCFEFLQIFVAMYVST